MSNSLNKYVSEKDCLVKTDDSELSLNSLKNLRAHRTLSRVGANVSKGQNGCSERTGDSSIGRQPTGDTDKTRLPLSAHSKAQVPMLRKRQRVIVATCP